MGKLVKRNWPILIIITFTFLTRIWHIDELFHFTYDESIPAFVSRRLILWHHIPLIGGVTPFNFHLGPYFYWFYAIILSVGKLNPISWGWAGAVMSIITTFLIFLVGQSFQSKRIGMTAAIIWAFSYLANVYDRHLWALWWGPLVSLIVIFSLYKIIKGSINYIYLLSFVIALAVHADLSNLVFLVLAVVVWIVYRLPIKKNVFIAIGIIILSFVPIIIFDIRHNFANTRPVADFLNQGRNKPGFEFEKFINNSLIFPRAFSRLVYTFGDHEIAKQYSYCQSFVQEKFQYIPTVFLLAVALIIIFFIMWVLFYSNDTHHWSKRGKDKTGWKLVAILLILYFSGIQIYGTIFKADIFEHYITGLFAVFLLIFAKVISLLPKKLWLGALAIFVALNLYKLSQAQNSLGFGYKREAINYTMQQVGEKDFSLDSLSTCWKYSGYRYLFAIFGREPVKSYVDPNFAYLYGTTPIAEKHPATVVVFVVHDFVPETDVFYRRYAILKSHETSTALFGRIEVIILDNSSDWFDKNNIGSYINSHG